MARYHQCLAPGCRQSINVSLFACAPHWRMLSARLRLDIYATKDLPVPEPLRWEVIQRAAREWERSGLG